MADIITLAVIALLMVLALRFIYKEKKKGIRCIGCPMSASCGKKEKDSCNRQDGK